MSSDLYSPEPAREEGKQPVNPSVQYERQDVDAGAILKFLAALFAALGLSLALIWGVYVVLGRWSAESPAEALLLREEAGRVLPPEPRLHGVPGTDVHGEEELRRLRARDEELLNAYGWVSEAEGIARIPIGVAMERLAERGLGPENR